MNTNKNFGELFNYYRLKAGLDTYGKFGSALAEEGFVYEDSIFSKWKNGERVPKDRRIILALIKIFINNGAITELDNADEILLSLGLRGLNDEEKLEMGYTNRMLSPYSKYSQLIEPSSIFNNTLITSENIQFYTLREISDEKIKNFWSFQANCAQAGYYATSTSMQKPPEHYFEELLKDPYSNNSFSDEIIGVTTDPNTGREYLSTTIRFLQGNSETRSPLSIMELMDLPYGWPHEHLQLSISEIGELDRLVIPNWAWQYNSIICRKGFNFICNIARRRRVRIIYAIVFSFVLDMLAEAEINVKKVPDAIPYYTMPNSQYLYPVAYRDYLNLTSIWEANPGLYILTDYDLGQEFV